MTQPRRPWYAQLREQWQPPNVRILLVAESAPDPGANDRRFFYAPTLTGADNLYRGVIEAFYGRRPGTAGDPKAPWLGRLKGDGIFLIDLCPSPVNKLSSRDRRLVLQQHSPALVAKAKALKPDGVIVCHGPTFKATAKPLRDAGLKLLHREPIPFPLGNWRAQFVAAVREASASL
jgi:hypothetical protein